MDLLDRLHQRLREAAPPDAGGSSSATIASVYQQLIPYRSVRGELGVWELAAYEHALLRLLAGERGYVRVEDDEVRLELQRELAAPNPILGIYRDYPDAVLRVLAPGRLPEVTDPILAPTPSPVRSSAASDRADAPTAPWPDPAPRRAPAPPPATGCRSCAEPLPDLPDLRFCPACGADQAEAPCAACGTLLRAEWNFCIRCGQRRADRTLPA